MYGIVFAALIPIVATTVPELAEIIEDADGAARVTVVDVAPIADTAVDGLAIQVTVTEALWGDPPASLTVWSPRSACGGPYKALDLIIGYRYPSEAQRAYLALPEGVALVCGSAVYREGLTVAIRRLKSAGDAETLLDLLAADGPEVRRQALRQLVASSIPANDVQLLGRLLPLAEAESDPALIRSYFSVFGHLRFEGASPVVTETLLATESAAVSESAERIFHRVARPEAVTRLVRAYTVARPATKERILRALAPMDDDEAQQLLAAAVGEEETVLPALDALADAGRPLPASVPEVRDPLRARRIRAILSRARRPKSPSPGGKH
jgi:hypothetical protein